MSTHASSICSAAGFNEFGETINVRKMKYDNGHQKLTCYCCIISCTIAFHVLLRLLCALHSRKVHSFPEKYIELWARPTWAESHAHSQHHQPTASSPLNPYFSCAFFTCWSDWPTLSSLPKYVSTSRPGFTNALSMTAKINYVCCAITSTLRQHAPL